MGSGFFDSSKERNDSKDFKKNRKISIMRKAHIYSFGPKNTLQQPKSTTHVSKIENKDSAPTQGTRTHEKLDSPVALQGSPTAELANDGEYPFQTKRKKPDAQVPKTLKRRQASSKSTEPNSSEIFWNYSPTANPKSDGSFAEEGHLKVQSSPSTQDRISDSLKDSAKRNSNLLDINKRPSSGALLIDKKFGTVLNLKNIVSTTSSSPTTETIASARAKHFTNLPGNDSFDKDMDDIIDGLQTSINKDLLSSEPPQEEASPNKLSTPLQQRKKAHSLLQSSPLKSQSAANEELAFTQKYGQKVFDLLDQEDWSTSFSNTGSNKSGDRSVLLKSDPIIPSDKKTVKETVFDENKKRKKSLNTSIVLPKNFDTEDDESLLDDIEDFMTQKKTTNLGHLSHMHMPQNFTKHLERSRTFPLNKEDNVYTVKPEYIQLAKYSNIPGKNNKGNSYKWFKRLVIVNCENLELKNSADRKTLLTCCDEHGVIFDVELEGIWRHNSNYQSGQILHLVEFATSSHREMLAKKVFHLNTSSSILLILNPDTLLTATVVGTSMDCMRRTVINEKFSFPGDPSLVMLKGIIVHEFFQELLLLRNLYTHEMAEDILERLLLNNKKELVICGCDDFQEFKDNILETYVPYMEEFLIKYCKQDNNFGEVRVSGQMKKEKMEIKDVVEIEEKIWSPVLGIRGVIDAHLLLNEEQSVPFEIKSGKRSSNSHVAQSSLYTFLVQDRYDIPCEEFLLCYVEGKDAVKYYVHLGHLQHLIHYRNTLSVFLTDDEKSIEHGSSNPLPPVLEHGSEICERCYCNRECTILNYFEQQNESVKENFADRKVVQEILLPKHYVQDLVGTLPKNSKNFKFYKKYMNLIDLEESSIGYLNKEMFTMDSEERRLKTGKCLGQLELIEVFPIPQKNQYSLTFYFPQKNLLDSEFKIGKGDYVILNDEMGHFNLSSATVTSISHQKNRVNCVTSIDISKIQRRRAKKLGVSRITYRMDKNEVGLGMSLSRYNVLSLFLPENNFLRELIVEGRAPRYGNVSRTTQFSSLNSSLDTSMVTWEMFNEDQQLAIRNALECKDYSLILGMPGTGKTTVIIEILKCLIIGNGKKVLISSYTHSAVDNILIKLEEECKEMKDTFRILRIGNLSKLHNDTKKYSPYYKESDDVGESESLDQNEDMLDSLKQSNLVAVTCLGIQDWTFSSCFGGSEVEFQENDGSTGLRTKRFFDYCILDEASQVSLPIALGPLTLCDKFVLVGDHFQLPPLILNEKAKQRGLDVSLFKKLNDYYPDIVKKLTYQYRMNPEIMKLSNELIYDGQLKCGGKNVDNKLPKYGITQFFGKSDNLVNWILDCDKKVCFINYDQLSDFKHIQLFKEMVNNEDIKNQGEMEIIKQLVVPQLLKIITSDQIGIMSLYRGQLNLLKKELLEHGQRRRREEEEEEEEEEGKSTLKYSTKNGKTFKRSKNNKKADYSKLEILTADQYQGRDKDCIMISFVRNNYDKNNIDQSNSKSKQYKILNDMERLNVAITRSKCKLIMIGSINTLKSVKNLKSFVSLLESQSWVYNLKDSDIPSSIELINESKKGGVSDKPGKPSLKRFTRNQPIIRDILAEHE
ncbi:hypothetical protein ACO0RG_002246 [Hanseniaspora osmophila]